VKQRKKESKIPGAASATISEFLMSEGINAMAQRRKKTVAQFVVEKSLIKLSSLSIFAPMRLLRLCV
jgi:hypothetical protein